MKLFQALIWVLASLASAHHYPATGGSSTSWTVWGSKPITGSLKPIFGSWLVKPVGVSFLYPSSGTFASKPITGSWGSKPIATKPSGVASKPQVGLELNSKWGPMAGTSAYKWSHNRPGSSSYQSVNFSYKMKPRPQKPHPPYKPPTAVQPSPTQPPPPSPPPQPTLPPYRPPTPPAPTTPSPPTTPASTTPPSLPDFLLPSPLRPLEDIDLPSGGAPTVLRPPSRLKTPLSPPCRPGLAPPCEPPSLSIFLP